jgi:hypothetical protein
LKIRQASLFHRLQPGVEGRRLLARIGACGARGSRCVKCPPGAVPAGPGSCPAQVFATEINNLGTGGRCAQPPRRHQWRREQDLNPRYAKLARCDDWNRGMRWRVMLNQHEVR